MEIQNQSDRLIDASDDVLCREIKELVAAWELHNNNGDDEKIALRLARAVYRLQGNLSINGLQRSEVKTGGGEHTPGPWQVATSGYANAPSVVFVGDKRPDFGSRYPLSGVDWIAEVNEDESPRNREYHANARLIAAAPELLEALVSLLDVSDFATNSRIGEIHLHCMAVIAKGGGR